jgi:hypothetical protein
MCSSMTSEKGEGDSQRTSHCDKGFSSVGRMIEEKKPSKYATQISYILKSDHLKWSMSRMQCKVVSVLRCNIPDLPYIANLEAGWESVPGDAYLENATGSPVVFPRIALRKQSLEAGVMARVVLC